MILPSRNTVHLSQSFYYIPQYNFSLYQCTHFSKLINLFLALMGLCWCAQAFSNCSEGGCSLVAVSRLLTAAASLVG